MTVPYRAALACLSLSLITVAAWADTVCVDVYAAPSGDGTSANPFQRIQDGIDAAVNGDTVLVANGTYTGSGNVNLDFGGKAITVKSEGGAKNCIIDCQNVDNTRGFFFNNSEGPDSVVDGFTIQNGRFSGEYPTGGGGAIACWFSSSPTIKNNIIKGNWAEKSGGGILCYTFCDPVIVNNQFIGNSAGVGGAIRCGASSPEIIGNVITGNFSVEAGGGLVCAHRSFSLVADNIITGNLAGEEAGGLMCTSESSPIIRSNLIADNTATWNGGGVLIQVECAPIFINNTITGNTANWDGGGFYCYDGVEPVVINTILWGNSPQEIFFGSEPAQTHTFTLDYTVDPIAFTISYSDVAGGLADIETNGLGTVNWGEGNIDRDPLFFDEPNSNYHLSDLSPCIGAGIMTADVPHHDIEGNPRPGPQDSAPDIGVYENSRGEPLTSIGLIAPNGGEVWRGGSSRNIAWDVVGAPVIHHIRLKYSIDGGGTYPNTITEGTDNDGIHAWNPVPGINSAAVRVKVIAEDSINNELISGASDSNFTIDSTAPETNIASLIGTLGENEWYISDVTIKLSATDNLSGVAQTSYKINDEEWTPYPAQGVILSGSDFYYRSQDSAGNVETEKSQEVKIDKSPPSVPVVLDDGDFTNSETQLHARWLSEAKSGISEYQYSIGTWQGGTDVSGWISAGDDTQVTVMGLDLVNGQTYYFGVKAKSNAGIWSDVGNSDGIAIDTSLEQEEVVLHSGWNLISVCLDPANTDMESLLISISGLYRSVWAYDALTTSWEQYVPTGPASSLTAMESGRGYLIDMIVPGTLTIIGRELTDKTIQLYSGWNCVGYNSTTPQPRATAMSSLSGSYIAIRAYDSETGEWMSHVVGVPFIANNLDELRPSMGFWILMNQDDEWILQQ